MCSLQRNYDVIRNWERFETGPLTVNYTFSFFFVNNEYPSRMALDWVDFWANVSFYGAFD